MTPWIIYAILAVINLFQAGHTELFHDEAYYWFYSQHLHWGYFDHPPALAVLIWLGSHLLGREIGVRLLLVALNIATLRLLELLIEPKSWKNYLAVILSIAVFQLAFFAFPDIPLLFFTVFFFWSCKRLLSKPDWLSFLWLTISMAGLVYSKYHGILVIGFALFSSRKFWKSGLFWGAGILAFVLFLPHLMWEYNHQFISFRYHLEERFGNPYKLTDTLGYLGGVLLLSGPLAGLLLFPAAIKNKQRDTMSRTYRFVLGGFIFFFLLNSFRGRTEPNWNIPALIPLIALALPVLESSSRWKSWVKWVFIFSLPLILVLRLWMLKGTGRLEIVHKDEIHGWENWAQRISHFAGKYPVVFYNSFQEASKYEFYTGKKAYSLNDLSNSGNEFDMLPIEDSLQGKTVLVMPNFPANFADTLFHEDDQYWRYKWIPDFQTFNKIDVEATGFRSNPAPGTTDTIQVTLINHFGYPRKFRDIPQLKPFIGYQYRVIDKFYGKPERLVDLTGKEIKDTLRFETVITYPKKAGQYNLWVYVRPGILPQNVSGYKGKVTVKP